MLNEKIINIDFNKIDNAIKECNQPIIIMMSGETLMVFIAQAETNTNIIVTEREFEDIITYKNIPIATNNLLEFGQVIVK